MLTSVLVLTITICINDFFILIENCRCKNVGTQMVDCDERCLSPATDPFIGLGCYAGGKGHACRFCGFKDFPPC